VKDLISDFYLRYLIIDPEGFVSSSFLLVSFSSFMEDIGEKLELPIYRLTDLVIS
jgi:hypothetical protein